MDRKKEKTRTLMISRLASRPTRLCVFISIIYCITSSEFTAFPLQPWPAGCAPVIFLLKKRKKLERWKRRGSKAKVKRLWAFRFDDTWHLHISSKRNKNRAEENANPNALPADSLCCTCWPCSSLHQVTNRVLERNMPVQLHVAHAVHNVRQTVGSQVQVRLHES